MVLFMDGLSADTEGFTDCLPGPAGSPGVVNVQRFDSIGEMPQSGDSPQSGCRVLIAGLLQNVGVFIRHICHPRLTDGNLSTYIDRDFAFPTMPGGHPSILPV